MLYKKNIPKKDIYFLFIALCFYGLAFFLLLLNKDALYWDDYTLYHHRNQDILKSFYDAGLPLFGYIHVFIGRIGNGIAPYRIATFIVYLCSGIFLYYILCGLKYFSKNAVGLITIFFLLLPVNNARITLVVFPYGLCLCLFFTAFFLLTGYLKKPSLLARGSILLIFFCSFLTNSFLIFYAIPLFYICHYHVYSQQNVNSLFEESNGSICLHYTTWVKYFSQSLDILFLRYVDFIVLPMIFLILKNTYYKPHGMYVGYNTIRLHKAFYNAIYSVKTAIVKPMFDLIITAGSHHLAMLLMVFFVACLKIIKITQVPKKQILFCLGLGLLFWVLAIFPYAAVNKIPDPGSFESRHMLLTPLGFSLITYAFFLLLAKIDTDIATGMCIVFIAACIFKNGYDQAFFLKDWFYQVALEENYKVNKSIREHGTFIFHSNVAWMNQRTINFCEHTARLKRVFGTQIRLMAPSEEVLTLIRQGIYNMDMSACFFEQWKDSKPKHIYAIKNPIVFDEVYFFKMLIWMYQDERLFRSEAKKLLNLTVMG